MDGELQNLIRNEANKLHDRGDRLDLAALVEIASEKTQVTARLINDLALSLSHANELGRPDLLIDFASQLATALRPARVLDPFVATPALLSAAVESSQGNKGLGFIVNHDMCELANRLPDQVSWRLGDFATASEADVGDAVDLIISSPPLGLMTRTPLEPGEPSYFKREYADLLLSRALPHLTDHGIAVVVVADGFFWSETRLKFRDELAERGFFLNAAIAISGSLKPLTAVPTSIAVFSRTETPNLFVARLSNQTSGEAVIANMLARRAGAADDLGILVSRTDYSGWEALALEKELDKELDSRDVHMLGSIGKVKRLVLKAGETVSERDNAVYIPAVGVGEVTTTPPEYEGKNRYEVFQVAIDPAAARADYVARWLSTPLGKRVRQAVSTVSVRPHLRRQDLASLRVVLPSLTEQTRVIATAQRIATVTATVNRLGSELWRAPREADRIDAQLERAAALDPIKGWCEVLPYPLASVLHRYVANASDDQKVNQLLHFFEMASEFGAAVLLSVFRRNEAFFQAERARLAEAASPPGRSPFDRLDFGVWLTFGQTLAKSARRIAADSDQEGAWTTAVGPAADLVERLSQKDYWHIADVARDIRNRRAHGGIVGQTQVEQWLDTLQRQLIQLLEVLDGCFDTAYLVPIPFP